MSNKKENTVSEVNESKGEETRKEKEGTEDDLLRKLEEQNRLLELDSRYTQRIDRTESNASMSKERSESILSTFSEIPSTIAEPEKPFSTVQEQSLASTSSDRTSLVSDCVETELTSSFISKESELLSNWGHLMKNWEEISKKNIKTIHTSVRQGIPDPLRAMAWQLLTGPQYLALKEQYPTLITESSPFEKLIQKDLARTFPEHPFFKDRDGLGQESLLNVMKAYSVYDREVGYCQGSLFIAGVLLMHMPEEEAFCVFVHLMNHHRLRDLYKPSMADLSLRFYQLESLVEEFFPKLDTHFRALGFQTSMYSSPWFLTLFASTLPLGLAFRIMDIFLMEGMEAIFRIGMALLEHSHDQLLLLDLEDMTKHFQKEIKVIHESDPDSLFEKAFRFKLSSKKLKKLEKEFIQKREKQLTDNSEISRLQDENCELEKRVVALEKECAALADRLIQGQVTRAQEYEDMYAVKRELTTLRKKVAAFEENEKSQKRKHKKQKSRSATPEFHSSKRHFVDHGNYQRDLRERSVSAPSLEEPNVPPSPTAFAIAIEELTTERQHSIKEMLEEEKGLSPISTNSIYSPSPDRELLLQDLATAKIERADALNLLERKKLELRQALQREDKLKKELIQAKETIAKLQQNVQEETDSSTQPAAAIYSEYVNTDLTSTLPKHPVVLDNHVRTRPITVKIKTDADTDSQYDRLVTDLKSVIDSSSTQLHCHQAHSQRIETQV